MPPALAAANDRTRTPNRSSRRRAAIIPPLRAKTKVPTRSRMSTSVCIAPLWATRPRSVPRAGQRRRAGTMAFLSQASPHAVNLPAEPAALSRASTTIRQEDLVQSIADALQYISYYHPVDYIRALTAAWEREESPAAKDAMAQILINSRMCAEGHRPICQDTGIVTVFLEIGMDVRWDDATMGVEDMVHEGVRRAYAHPDNKLRASVLADPAGKRINTKDNTPGVVNVKVVPGNKVDVIVAAKGGGSEAK